MSQDPLGFAAGDPKLYRYAGNAPRDAMNPCGTAGGPRRITLQDNAVYWQNG